jgi:hypothetical protein
LVGYVTDVRVYLAAKYTSSFSIATEMVPLVAVAKPNPRSIQFQALAASYRRMLLFVGTVDVSTELTTTVAPRAFPFPTTVRAFSTASAFHTATTALTFSILPWDRLTPGRVVLYTTTTAGAEPTELGAGAVDASGNVRIVCAFPTVGTNYVSIRGVNPEGLMQPDSAPSTPLVVSVTPYPMPNAIVATTGLGTLVQMSASAC